MAITFRSAGARLKTDVSASGGSHSVALPTGHVLGDLLLLVVVTDDNTGPTATPTGWTLLGKAVSATSTATFAGCRVAVFRRADTGALGSGVTVTFSTAAFPTGNPYVLAFTLAYTGCDLTGPVETWHAAGTANTAATQTHPQLTTTVTGDWLLTLRTGSAWAARTVTLSGAADTERVDDNDGFGELVAALYDSDGAGLAPGTQAQRSTTTSGSGDSVCQGGSTLWSLALKPSSVAASAFALAGVAAVAVAASGASVDAVAHGWELCAADGLPSYRFAIDWSGEGSFTDPDRLGATYVSDTFGRSVTGGWGTTDTGQVWDLTVPGGGALSDFSVTGGTGVHSAGTRNAFRTSLAPSVSADVDVAVDFSVSATAAGDSNYVFLIARYTGTSSFYFARVQMTTSQGMILSLRKRNVSETQITSFTTGLTHAAGTVYTVRLRVTGSALWAKVWATGTAEPDWQTTAVDTDLTSAGSVGVRTLVGASGTGTLPVVFSFDNFRSSEPLDAEDVARDIVSDISVTYGRDQDRQLSPAAVGSASFTLNNAGREYSPENVDSPLFGDLNPARAMTGSVDFNGQVQPLFRGRIDDFKVTADFSERTAAFTFLDGLNDLQGIELSTGVYSSQRTGDLIHAVLDAAGWTAGRDVDTGATVVRYWWLEGTDALSAVNDLVRSEGPPAVAYVAPDGTFVFRDRHHRLMRAASRTSRATFHAGRLGDCDGEGVPAGAFSLTKPFTYTHGWRDIVNAVAFDVAERAPGPAVEAVWTDESTYALALGQSVDIDVSGSDPFIGAVTPVPGTDIVHAGPGVLDVLLSRTSGASARLTLRAVGGAVTVSGIRLRARSLPVRQTVRVSLTDPGSVSAHGERTYPEGAPWAGVQDAEAIANMVLLHYAHRRPTVQIRVVAQNPAHFVQVLQRTISDRIRIVNGEMGLDDDFFVERVTHEVQRVGRVGRPPVHAVVLGCEKDLDVTANPFRFDVRGAGFDEGVFDPLQADSPDEVFKFDDPVQGQFDQGVLGT